VSKNARANLKLCRNLSLALASDGGRSKGLVDHSRWNSPRAFCRIYNLFILIAAQNEREGSQPVTKEKRERWMISSGGSSRSSQCHTDGDMRQCPAETALAPSPGETASEGTAISRWHAQCGIGLTADVRSAHFSTCAERMDHLIV
jgi:hypothetical protein